MGNEYGHARLTGAVFIDLSKAFDTVDHSKLLSKLCVYGITDTELLWFTNYLADRRQLVQYRNVSSDYSVISSEVPQGSILGPLLFVIFVNDLPSIVSRCSVLMYADDQGRQNWRGRRGGRPPCLLLGGAMGTEVPFGF